MIIFSPPSGRQHPARDLIRDWLKAGVFEAGKGFAPTGEGTPQGGVISPCLLNVALHGLEEAAGVRYVTSGKRAGDTMAGSPVVIRYADNVVVLCHSQEQAVQVKARLAEWLAPRGLAFNEDKTKVVHLSEGFDFLAFNVRRYQRKLLIKPSKAAIRRLRERLASEMRTLRGSNAAAVIAVLTPVIRGSPGDAILLHDVVLTGRLARFCGASPRVRCSWLVVVHAAQREIGGSGDAGFPGEDAVGGEVLDGAGRGAGRGGGR